ncbi:hypothetical protein CK910_01150 [Aeromonas sp. CA23]|nr:hypothetical protein CK910_01150 [Aeromonas sp. CA23]
MDSLNADPVTDYTTGGVADGPRRPKPDRGETGMVAAGGRQRKGPRRALISQGNRQLPVTHLA